MSRLSAPNRKLAGTFLAVVTLLAAAAFFSPAAQAAPQPTSDLLLPYFEVDLTGFHRTTLFQVTNSGDERVEVKMTVHSNWGIPMEEVRVRLDANETRGFNLRDWLLLGDLPQLDGSMAALAPQRLAHTQSALAGQASPMDQLFYATEVIPDMAVGYVTIRAQGPHRADSLWGNWYIVDPDGEATQADILVDIDPTRKCKELCDRHLLFFLDGGVFDGGTEVIVWNSLRAQPSPTPEPGKPIAGVRTRVRNLQGDVVFEKGETVLGTQTVTLEDVVVFGASGSMEMATVFGPSDRPVESFIGIRYTAEQQYSAAVRSWCDPREPQLPPSTLLTIDLEKYTNGHDADEPTGPQLAAGDAVTWEYVVTNPNDVALTDVVVTDDQGVLVSCPKTTLAAGESMTCTGHGTAVVGQYANLGTVTALGPEGESVGDSDPSHYFVPPEPVAIQLEKATNGFDADAAPGPKVELGSQVTWTYVVTNTSDVTLTRIVLDDDREGSIDCPKQVLAAGESMTCTHFGTAVEGQYANLATVTGQGPGGQTARDTDPSHYHGEAPPLPVSIDLEKSTNGQDADAAPGPKVEVGSQVTWEYVVTNDGEAPLSNVALSDDKEGSVSCPKSSLAVGESMTCTATGIAIQGQYANLATVTAEGPEGQPVDDSDPSHYHGEQPPEVDIDLEKSTNGHDADVAPGPELEPGAAVTWTYVVTNTGEATITGIVLDDDQEGAITCPSDSLEPGESMTCVAHGVAIEGQYANLATVTGSSDGQGVTDNDPSHYHGEAAVGTQGCTPGYWKNHTDSWPPTGWSSAQSVASVFSAASAYPSHGNATLLEALSFQGGAGVEGGVGNLLRAAVAGLLDASHPGVDYPRSAAALIADVDAALASGDRDTMLSLAAGIDRDNNLGCPLN